MNAGWLGVTPDKPLGEYLNIYLARSTKPEILNRKPNGGGAVTSLLVYMLDKRIVDAVVTVRKNMGLRVKLSS